MGQLRTFVTRHPRFVCAVAFGLGATAVVYCSVLPDSAGRLRGFPLAAYAGIAHAVAAAFTGVRIVNPRRSPELLYASLWGAATSLLALLLFALALTVMIYHPQLGDRHPFFLLLFTLGFAYLGAGWALMLMSLAFGWGICRLGSTQSGISKESSK